MNYFLGLFLIAVSASAIHASVIVQQQEPPATPSLGHYIAFEAENYDSVSDASLWTIVSESDAHNGSALRANKPDSARGLAHYQLKFAVAGTYYLYARMRAASSTGGYDHHNSFTFLMSTDTAEPVATLNTYDLKYNWFRSTVFPWSITIAPSDVGQIVTATLKVKVTDMVVDRLILSTSDYPGVSFDSVVNSPILVPEPSAGMWLGALLAAPLARRPRRSV